MKSQENQLRRKIQSIRGALAFAAIALLAPARISPEENGTESARDSIDGNLVVTEISFTGLTRTRESFLKKEYEKHLGKTVSETNLHDIENDLQSEGLFETFSVSFRDIDGQSAGIVVEVTEKMTFIPLPFAMVSSGGFSAGAIVMDTNAFGVKDMFMVGGFYSSSSIAGIASVARPPRNDGTPGLSAFASVSKNEPKVVGLDNKNALEYRNLSGSAKLSVAEKITEKNMLSVSAGFSTISADERDGKPAASVDSAKIGSLSASWNFLMSDWNGWFSSATKISAEFSASKYFGLDDESELSGIVADANMQLGFQKPFISERLRAVGKIAGDFVLPQRQKSAHISEYKGGSAVGCTILPDKFLTDKIIGASIGIEFALKKYSFGLSSLYANYEAVLTKDFSLGTDTDFSMDEFCHGPNAGIRLYLSKIAFPAVALGMSYNVTKKYGQFTAALGISM